MNLLQMIGGNKSFGARRLLQDAGFAVNEGEHIGVIGPNGAGKTTLFKILVGHESLDSGNLSFSRSLRLGYLEQDADWELDQTGEHYLTENCLVPLWELKQKGRSLGLSQAHFDKPLGQLSGGFRMRMKLLYLIGQKPNLMLLDEPTNYLDLESVLALEMFLQNYEGAFLLISHDREFLRRTTESTLEVEAGQITKFPGHIDDYFEQKEELMKVQASQAANLEVKRKHLQDFVDRFRAKATKAKQAQSRMKMLEKMEPIAIRNLPIKAKINIPEPERTGKEILSLDGGTLGYPDKVILRNVRMRLTREAHVGVVGLNGAGKSTLLKSLAQKLPLLSGNLKIQTTFSYFAQHVAEDLNLEDTVIQALQSAARPDIKNQDILDLAGALLFSGDAIYKKIRLLSGGEKSRVALGQIFLKRSPLLILDEPTNHLDFDTVEALSEALNHYTGALVIVSHDRSFLRRTANQILEIRDGSAEIYPGTYDEYVWSLEKGALQMLSTTAPPSGSEVPGLGASKLEGPASPAEKRNYKEDTKKLQSKIKEFERKAKKLEESIQGYSKERDQLNLELVGTRGPGAQSLALRLGELGAQIEQAEEDMLLSLEEAQKLNEELLSLKT